MSEQTKKKKKKERVNFFFRFVLFTSLGFVISRENEEFSNLRENGLQVLLVFAQCVSHVCVGVWLWRKLAGKGDVAAGTRTIFGGLLEKG